MNNNTSIAPSGAKKAFPDWLLGVSFAADWTWAVAVLVGISILRTAGILPFILWFAANTAAIPFFGWLSRKYPGLWNQTRRGPMRILMTIMLIFTMWINMTGIQTSGAGVPYLNPGLLKLIPILVALGVWVATFHSGIRWSVWSDRFQWAAELGSVLLIAGICVVQKGLIIEPGLKFGSYANLKDWIYGFWTIPLLLSNPFLDGSFWHRAAYAKSMRPYWWGYGMFTVYLLAVVVIGLVGFTPLASNILFYVIFFASFSTIDSMTAGLQLTAGKKLGNALGGIAAVGWLLVSNTGLLDLWIALFVWYPFLFAIQILTYQLEKNGKLKPLGDKTLMARDALPLIQQEDIDWSKEPAGD